MAAHGSLHHSSLIVWLHALWHIFLRTCSHKVDLRQPLSWWKLGAYRWGQAICESFPQLQVRSKATEVSWSDLASYGPGAKTWNFAIERLTSLPQPLWVSSQARPVSIQDRTFLTSGRVLDLASGDIRCKTRRRVLENTLKSTTLHTYARQVCPIRSASKEFPIHWPGVRTRGTRPKIKSLFSLSTHYISKR